LSLRTSNALKALVSSEQVRFNFLSSRLKQSELMVGSQMKSGRVPDCGAGNRKSPTAISVELPTALFQQLHFL